jgi:hypothetical protein
LKRNRFTRRERRGRGRRGDAALSRSETLTEIKILINELKAKETGIAFNFLVRKELQN